jgi:hypothetical protein
MPADFLKRVIERASDSLVKDAYQRILVERRAAQGQVALPGTVPTWEEIAARAVAEAILTQEEGALFVAEVRRTGGEGAPISRRGVLRKQSTRQGLDRTGGDREDTSRGASEKAKSE